MIINRNTSSEQGTFGTLTDDNGIFICYTVELPWADNHTQLSCIPDGVYLVEQYQSPKHGQVWQIMDVPNRSNIEIHAANVASELLGCIGVGDSLGSIEGFPAVLNSQSTLQFLRNSLPNNFTLTIKGLV